MSTCSNQLQPALQNLLQCVIQFFHPKSSCKTTHISADVHRITLNASCMMISGGRTKQLDIFCRVTGFTCDFLSLIVVELTRFFHAAIQLFLLNYLPQCLDMVGCMTEVHPAFRNLTPAIPEGSPLGVLWRRGLTCSYLWKNILVKQKMVTVMVV